MKHYLHAPTLERNPKVSITQDEFGAIRMARQALNAAFTLEEIYDLVLGNYRELEVAILAAAVEETTRWKDGYGDHFAARSEFNRRTLNLLSAARLYLDQHQSLLKRLGANPEEAERQRRAVYDASFEYRFMEALRNHAQHAGRAVHGVGTSTTWLPPERRELLEYRTTPYAMKASLSSDPKFKRSVLAECPEKIPIAPAARAYVGGLSAVHQQVRLLASSHIEGSRGTIERAIEKHRKRAKRRFIGLTAIAEELDGSIEEVPVFLEWDDVRVRLARKNRPVTNLRQRYATGRPHDA